MPFCFKWLFQSLWMLNDDDCEISNFIWLFHWKYSFSRWWNSLQRTCGYTQTRDFTLLIHMWNDTFTHVLVLEYVKFRCIDPSARLPPERQWSTKDGVWQTKSCYEKEVKVVELQPFSSKPLVVFYNVLYIAKICRYDVRCYCHICYRTCYISTCTHNTNEGIWCFLETDYE